MNKKLKWFAGLLADVLIIAGITFLLTQFVVSIGTVNGKSMEPTLVEGQKLIVDRVSYRLSDPNRFDVVVVKFPSQEEFWIKRIIGLPGDLIEYRGKGQLYVNGAIIEEPFLSEDVVTSFFTTKLFFPGTGIIPEGQYLVMGDNRNNSTDGRILGTLAKDDIMGIARLSIWPLDRFSIMTKEMTYE